MLNINLLTSVTNSYLSKFETVDKKSSIETALIAINENISELEKLKNKLKNESDSLSVGNILSLCLSISNYTKEIKETNFCLNSHH